MCWGWVLGCVGVGMLAEVLVYVGIYVCICM